MSARTFVTGFGPFLNVIENPSATVAAALDRPHQVLEVSFDAADRFLGQIDPESFDNLLLIGVARGRTKMCPELFARNQIGHTKDVRGVDRFGPIEEGGPLLVEGGLWDAEQLLIALGDPRVHVSLDAGSYLCNYTYYRAARAFPKRRVGFLHLPDVAAITLEEQILIAKRLLEMVEKGG